MKKNLLFFLYFLLFSSVFLIAQNEVDALRYSTQTGFGTARAMGLGGAMSAVGADMTAAALNPAGLGLYQFSDISFTPAIIGTQSNSEFFDQKNKIANTNFIIGNTGAVFCSQRHEDKQLKSHSFAITYNRMTDYHRSLAQEVYNSRNSVTDYFAQLANNGGNVNDLNSYEGAAYNAYGINPTSDNSQYYGVFSGGEVQQNIAFSQKGRRDEYAFAWGGNWNDKLYLGAKIGIQNIHYRQTLYIEEKDTQHAHDSLQDNSQNGTLNFPADRYTFRDGFSTSGSGVNLQIGIIYRPVDAFRIALSAQTPTRLALHDDFSFSMHNEFSIHNQDSVADVSSAALTSTYRLRTPAQVHAGAMYMFGKNGFITADATLLDYRSALFSSSVFASDSSYYSYKTENAAIREQYKLTLNYRIGAEYRLNAFRLRAGAGVWSRAVQNAYTKYQSYTDLTKYDVYNPMQRYWTLGAGYRGRNGYIDIAYMYMFQDDAYTPYGLSGQNVYTPGIAARHIAQTVSMTFGLSF